MALTVGTGPFSSKRAGEFNFDTSVLRPHTLYFEESPKRIRVEFGGETVADSRRAKLLYESNILPLYYFPEEDVRMDLLEPTDHTTHCPFKGDAAYWNIRVGDRVAENAAWGYPEPLEEAPPLAGYVALYFDRMDRWYEEDEEIFAHPRDPYHRIDVLQSSRHVRVTANGETIAETNRPTMLFETGLPARYYVPREDVREDWFSSTDKTTGCPYKGTATYRNVEAGGQTFEDAVWTYEDPLPEAAKIKDLLSFLGEGIELEVDGERVA